MMLVYNKPLNSFLCFFINIFSFFEKKIRILASGANLIATRTSAEVSPRSLRAVVVPF